MRLSLLTSDVDYMLKISSCYMYLEIYLIVSMAALYFHSMNLFQFTLLFSLLMDMQIIPNISLQQNILVHTSWGICEYSYAVEF